MSVAFQEKYKTLRALSIWSTGMGKRVAVSSKVQTEDSCFGLIGPHQCSAALVLRHPALHREEGSGMASLLKLFCWNAIEIMRVDVFLCISYATQ